MKSKICFLLAIAALTATTLTAAANTSYTPQAQAQDIALPTPQKNGGKTLMEALANRHSIRSFSDKELSLQELSNLLWAANGINREDGKRTAPSAVDARDIELYVSRSGGTFRYNPEKNVLEKVSDNDFRPVVANHNGFIKTVPTVILLISNQGNFGKKNFHGATSINFGSIDAGIVAQNICLYSASMGWACVPCAPRIDAAAVQTTLGLSADYLPEMYLPVGFPR